MNKRFSRFDLNTFYDESKMLKNLENESFGELFCRRFDIEDSELSKERDIGKCSKIVWEKYWNGH